jgi:hypothetical protein
VIIGTKWDRLYLAADLNISSLIQDEALYSLISQRIQTYNSNLSDGNVIPSFESIVNFENIIDIPTLITQGKLTFNDILTQKPSILR